MDTETDFIMTPNGLRHRLQVHHIGAGSLIQRGQSFWRKLTADGQAITASFPIASTPTPPPGPETGWVSYADWRNTMGRAITLFETRWEVPPAPATGEGQLIYLFNALQTRQQDHILQPVLQWGKSPAADQPSGWAIASWWVGQKTDPSFITDIVPVKTGDKFTGRIALMSSNNGLFKYACEFVGTPGTRLIADKLPELTDCTATLEAYHIATNSDYPAVGKVVFEGVSLQSGGGLAELAWVPGGPFPAVVVNGSAAGGEIHIIFPNGER